MSNIVFEDRVVAFFDVLEFKSFVESFNSGGRTFLGDGSKHWERVFRD